VRGKNPEKRVSFILREVNGEDTHRDTNLKKRENSPLNKDLWLRRTNVSHSSNNIIMPQWEFLYIFIMFNNNCAITYLYIIVYTNKNYLLCYEISL